MNYLVGHPGVSFDSFYPTHIVGTFWKVRRKSDFAQVGIEYARDQLCISIYKAIQFISKLPHN
jgi:hypothetical protein